MKSGVPVAAAFYLIASSVVMAEEPKAFVCRFSGGVSARYENGWRLTTAADVMTFTFAGLDPQRGIAHLVEMPAPNRSSSSEERGRGISLRSQVSET
jgi:hypothetical protein